MDTNSLHTDSTVHVFEKAGLGKAPFEFLGVEIRRYCPAPGVSFVGGACAYCYTGIVECCVIRSADGKQFIVGNECVKKTYDKGLINVCKTALNAERRKAKHVKDDAKIAELRAWVDDPANFGLLDGTQSPHSGHTLLASARWYLTHAGRHGCVWIYGHVKKALEQRKGAA